MKRIDIRGMRKSRTLKDSGIITVNFGGKKGGGADHFYSRVENRGGRRRGVVHPVQWEK